MLIEYDLLEEEFFYNGPGRCLVKGCCRATELNLITQKRYLICSACFYGADEYRFELAVKAKEFYKNLRKYYIPPLRIRR